jgi:hypothetical protein
MRAFSVTDFDSPPSLEGIDIPTPKQGEVCIQIQACGLNFADLLMAKGTYQDTPKMPFTLGMEVCGIVTAQGAFRWQTALDQMHWCQSLHNAALLVRAGVLGADGHNHFGLSGHNFQPLCAVFADTHHVATSAGADDAVRLNDLFNALQMLSQIAKVIWAEATQILKGTRMPKISDETADLPSVQFQFDCIADGEIVVYQEEPGASWLTQISLAIIGFFPVEWML